MDDLVCITVMSRPAESQAAFSTRLSGLWTTMLREHKDDFERVYAETTAFENHGNRMSRQYLAEPSVIDLVERLLRTAGLDYQPIDRDDTYSKFEAVAPDWMQIEH